MSIFALTKNIDMRTIAHASYSQANSRSLQFGLFTKFFAWCASQEKNHFGWLALSLAAHGCIITPLVVAFVGFTGNNFVLWIAAMAAMGATLVVNLAAMPTKITIPTFVLSVIADIAIIIACIAQAAG
jgi:Na+/melibiose symporter-like transporter